MHFVLELTNAPGRNHIILEHGDEQLLWSAASLGKTDSKDLPDIFTDINHYWQSLDSEEVDRIWELYKELHECIQDNEDIVRMEIELKRLISQLMVLHPYEKLCHFFRTETNVLLPTELNSEYSIESPEGALTYLKHDYVDLLELIFAMRVVIPVLGAYMCKTKKIIGVSHKEVSAVRLLANTELPTTEPFNRLMDYVEAYVSSMDTSAKAIINKGLGSAHYPEYFFSLILIRRLATIALVSEGDRMERPPVNIISNIFNFIRTQSNQLDKVMASGKQIKNKRGEGQGYDEDERGSFSETYKIKTPVDEGSLEVYNVYAMNPINIAKKIDETIDESLVEMTVDYIHRGRVFEKHDAGMILTKWTMSTVISSSAVDHLDFDALKNVYAITQALMLHWLKTPDLALLISAKFDLLPVMSLVGLKFNSPSLEQQESLLKIYPYYRVDKANKKTIILPTHGRIPEEVNKQQNINNNEVFGVIDELSKKFLGKTWTVHKGSERDFSKACGCKPSFEVDDNYGTLVHKDLTVDIVNLLTHIHHAKRAVI